LKIEDNGWRIGVGSIKKKEKKKRVKVNGQMLGMMMKSKTGRMKEKVRFGRMIFCKVFFIVVL
jgi:hypothetical protein